MIYGGGLEATDREDSDGKKEQWLRLQDLLYNSDDDLLKKLALDIKLYGMCYVNVIWNNARTRIARIKHLPVHTMRSGVADSEGNIDVYYYKSDWHDKREKEKAIKTFSLDDRTAPSTCLQIKRYSVSYHYYGISDYVGGTNYIELDREISAFHLSNIRRGFFPSMLLSFKNGVPTDEERRTIEQKVIQKFTGPDNSGRILITFNDGDETAPEFTPINTNAADGMYEYLTKTVSEKILTSHRVTSPLLFGIRGEGTGFGNNADELRDSFSLFNNTVIVPFQDILLSALRKLFAVNDISLDLFFIPSKPADFININSDEVPEQVKEDFNSHTEELADALIELGVYEDELLKDFELIDSRQVDYETEDVQDAVWTFATVPSSKPQADSAHPEWGQDTELIKVRYVYTQGKFAGIGKSREFCSKMMRGGKTKNGLKIGSRVYRKEDIMLASERAVNPGWGPGGTNYYNLWYYKGGGNCQHFWTRQTYLKKGNKKITVKEAKKIIREADGQRLQVNDKRVAQAPRTWKNKGFIKPMN